MQQLLVHYSDTAHAWPVGAILRSLTEILKDKTSYKCCVS